MGLNTIVVVCPQCETTNTLTADDLIVNAELGCSNCHTLLGLLRDFIKSPRQQPHGGAQAIQAAHCEDPDEAAEHPN